MTPLFVIPEVFLAHASFMESGSPPGMPSLTSGKSEINAPVPRGEARAPSFPSCATKPSSSANRKGNGSETCAVVSRRVRGRNFCYAPAARNLNQCIGASASSEDLAQVGWRTLADFRGPIRFKFSNSRVPSCSVEFLGESDEKPFRPADVAKPIRVLIPDYFTYELCAPLAKPAKSLFDVVHGEHDAEVA